VSGEWSGTGRWCFGGSLAVGQRIEVNGRVEVIFSYIAIRFDGRQRAADEVRQYQRVRNSAGRIERIPGNVSSVSR
jgi:hypothetical protein